MPNNLRLSRQDLGEIFKGNAKWIRAFEEMFASTAQDTPDSIALLLTLATTVATSAEAAAASADAAARLAESALAQFATLPEPYVPDGVNSALQAQIAAIPEQPRDYGVFYAVASEPLAEGAIVSMYDNAGTPTARNADAGPSNYEAICFTEAACGTGAIAQLRTVGINDRLSGLTTGLPYYLSDTTPGDVTSTAPVTVGNLLQPLGIAISSTALAFTYNAASII